MKINGDAKGERIGGRKKMVKKGKEKYRGAGGKRRREGKREGRWKVKERWEKKEGRNWRDRY